MKYTLYLLAILTISCVSKNQDPKSAPPVEDTVLTGENKSPEKTDDSWEGTLDGKIPVFVHYQLADSLLMGEITYLNTRNQAPIRLLGNIQEDSTYRLLEFEPTGNITGILTGRPGSDEFTGTWYSPKGKTLALRLQKSDTTIPSVSYTAGSNDIYGNYYYQYGMDGYQGSITVNKVDNQKISFTISSVTGAPARNIADVPADTVSLAANSFHYTIPGSDTCSFRVQFYKNCMYVKYTHGYCQGQFGHNATVEGLYVKIK